MKPQPMTSVFYKCKKCGLSAEVRVSARDNPDIQPVEVWVQNVGLDVYTDHVSKRPDCNEKKVDLALPMRKETDPQDWWIGMPCEQKGTVPEFLKKK
jgi:hypothetical protein